MTHSIVFSSLTGNTELLARRAQRLLGEEGRVYFGAPEDAPEEAANADVILAGSWANRGTCTEELATFLRGLRNRRVFLFGTCGAELGAPYHARVLGNMAEYLDESCEVAGSYMCQGKMGEASRARRQEKYDAAEPGSEEQVQAAERLKAWERALTHPDADDLLAFDEALRDAGLA